MSVSKILLADRDLEYGEALARAVSNLHNEFEISVMSLASQGTGKIDGKIAFQEFDLILIGGYPEEIVSVIRDKVSKGARAAVRSPDGRIVVLTDYAVESLKAQSEKDGNNLWYIFKYVNVNEIISDLAYLAGIVAGKKSLPRKSCTPALIGFYSIAGGSGKTAAAFGTSRELFRYHDKKVLYLSFEEIPATGLLFRNSPGSRNIGDYLYYLLEKKEENFCLHPDGFTSTDDFGVETFCPADGRNDLNELTQEELIWFLNIISESGRYDYIMLDLKGDLAENTLFLINLCSKIILVRSDEPTAAFKTAKLLTYLDKLYGAKWKQKLLLVVNKVKSAEYDREIPGDYPENDVKKIDIEHDESSFRYHSGHLDIDIGHTFGIGIKKIADEILES